MLSLSLPCFIVFFSSLARSRYLSFFSLSFSLALWSTGTTKYTIRQLPFSLLIITCVKYWPSTEASIKRCTCVNQRKKQVHPVEYITLTCGRVESGANATPTRSRWMLNNYITRCHRRFESVGVRRRVRVGVSWGTRCQRENQLADRGLAALRTHCWAAQQNEEEVLLWSKELWVNM